MNALHRSIAKAHFAVVLLVADGLLLSCATVRAVPSGVRSELAPSGKLRAAINFGNTVLAQKEPATGEPHGVSVDLARELGRRLNVPVELVTFDAAGKVFDALKTNAWDVAFLAIDPARASEIAFTAPYVVIEGPISCLRTRRCVRSATSIARGCASPWATRALMTST